MRARWMVAALVFCPLAARADAPATFPLWMGNGLLRTLSEQDRTYFGRPLADVVAAMTKASKARQKGPCSVEVSQGGTTDLSKPSQFVRNQGRLTPAGLAPVYWEIPVSCPGLKALVSLSAVPITVVPPPGEKTGKPGEDVFNSSRRLVIGDFTLATAPGEDDDAPTPTTRITEATAGDVPTMAVPRAVQIEVSRSAGNLKDFIDVDAARAALAAVKAPAARPAPAVEAGDTKASPEAIHEAETSALAFLVARENKREKTVIVGKTWRGGLPSEAEKVLPQVAPDLLGSAIVDYRAKNEESQAFPADLSVPGTSVVIVPEASLQSYFQGAAPAAAWAKFRKDFGDDQLFTFSRVGLSHDLTQGVVFMGYQGESVGTSSIFFLKRDGPNWRVLYQLRVVVS